MNVTPFNESFISVIPTRIILETDKTLHHYNFYGIIIDYHWPISYQSIITATIIIILIILFKKYMQYKCMGDYFRCEKTYNCKKKKDCYELTLKNMEKNN